MEKLYIVIPAYNEEETIKKIAYEWHKIVEKIGKDSRLIIIDDGSKDSTYKKLCTLKENLPQLEPLTKSNTGHGSTLLYGYNYAIKAKADYIFQTDSDGQTLSSEFYPFWKNRHKFSAIIGYRNHRKDGFSRIIVTKVLKLVLRIIFKLDITDANTPYRLMKREILEKYISQVPKDFNLSNVMLTVLFLDNKEKVKFVPITFRPRQGGINSINLIKISKIGFNAIKDFRAIRKDMNLYKKMIKDDFNEIY